MVLNMVLVTFFEGLGDKAIQNEFNLDVMIVTNLK